MLLSRAALGKGKICELNEMNKRNWIAENINFRKKNWSDNEIANWTKLQAKGKIQM